MGSVTNLNHTEAEGKAVILSIQTAMANAIIVNQPARAKEMQIVAEKAMETAGAKWGQDKVVAEREIDIAINTVTAVPI